MSEIKVSVIVPIYNVEKYLRRCVESLINQTLKDIEIILVNDGSTDGSGKICDEYLNKDNKIKVIHQENAGLSAARNIGIANSKGEYISFIDSDDYVEADMMEYLYNGIKKNNADISSCGYTNIYENGDRELITLAKEERIYSIKEALDMHLFVGYIDVIACNKMYKKNLFDNIKFPEGLLYEDMLTTYKLIDKSNKIVLLPDSKYLYCKRKTSIGGSSFSEKTLKLLDACDEATDFVINKYPDLKNIKISKIQWYIVVLNKMITSNCVDKNLVKKIKKMIKKELKEIIKTKHLMKIRKLQILLLYLNFNLYKKIYISYIQKKR